MGKTWKARTIALAALIVSSALADAAEPFVTAEGRLAGAYQDDVDAAFICLVLERDGNLTNDAYLLNLDITNAEGFSYRFSISGITVKDDEVDIDVTLERTGAVRNGDQQSPINGTLKFYGAETLAAFKSGTATPLVTKTLSDDDFSDGETTTATFDKDGNVFFDAKIE